MCLTVQVPLVLICEHKDFSAFFSASVHMGRGQSENSLNKLIISFYHVGPGDLTQVVSGLVAGALTH